MVRRSELLKAIVQAGLTFSDEKNDGYVMRNCDALRVVGVVLRNLEAHGYPTDYDLPILDRNAMDCD